MNIYEPPVVIHCPPIRVRGNELKAGDIVRLTKHASCEYGYIPVGDYVVLQNNPRSYALDVNIMIRSLDRYMNGETQGGWLTYGESPEKPQLIGARQWRGSDILKIGTVVLYPSTVFSSKK